jgi:shikimate dehydrogenase
VVARNTTRAQVLSEDLGASWRADPYGMAFDLVVHATPIGMPCGPDPDGLPIALERLVGHPAVVDLVYGERPTPLVARARALGLAAIGGETMLAAQAQRSFALWFGEAPPVARFLEALRSSSHLGSTT